MNITEQQLHQAFIDWENDRINGKCMSPDEVDKMAPLERAVASANSMWARLTQLTATAAA